MIQERGHSYLAMVDGGHKGADRNSWLCKACPREKMTGLVSTDRLNDWRMLIKPSHRGLQAQVIRRTEEHPENWEIAGRWGGHKVHAERTLVYSLGLRWNTGRNEEVVLGGPEGLRNHLRNKQNPPFVHEGLQGFTEQESCRTKCPTGLPLELSGK